MRKHKEIVDDDPHRYYLPNNDHENHYRAEISALKEKVDTRSQSRKVAQDKFIQWQEEELYTNLSWSINIAAIETRIKQAIHQYANHPADHPIEQTLPEIILHKDRFAISPLYSPTAPQNSLIKIIQELISVLALNAFYVWGLAKSGLPDEEYLAMLMQLSIQEWHDYAMNILENLKRYSRSTDEAILYMAAEKSHLNELRKHPEFADYFNDSLSMAYALAVHFEKMQQLEQDWKFNPPNV